MCWTTVQTQPWRRWKERNVWSQKDAGQLQSLNKILSQLKSFEFWTGKERLLFISRYVLSLRRGNWKSWTSSAEISVHMCAGVCLFWVLGQRFIASMHTHACTHTSHTHGKQRCRDPSLSTSQAQPSIHFSQWPRNEWQDKQKPPHQVYKFYHRSESVYR